MLKFKMSKLCSVAPAALLALSFSPAWAGTFDDAPVLGIFGDGTVFSDIEEGILEPGIKAVTTTPNADFPNTKSPSGIDNCLMANNPDFECQAPQGSGKRIKTRLDGTDGMDISLSTQSSSGISEYFLYGKTSNLTGARVSSLTLQLGTGTGLDFTPMDASDPALAALFDVDYENRFNLPDGLFGNGGQEDAGIGFFDEERGLLAVTRTDAATLDAVSPTNAVYKALFGDAILDNSMLPDAFFWDASATALASDEPIPLAWYNNSQAQWVYGNLGITASPELDERLQILSDSLGVTVTDLAYVGGAAVPDDIAALMLADPLFEEAPLEDLRNVNLNFIIDLGDVDGNQVTLRITPQFADIVAGVETQDQFETAAFLDAMANVPYMDLGNSAVYQAAISSLLAMSAEERANGLESIDFSFLQAFPNIGFEFSRNQISTIMNSRSGGNTPDVPVSSKGLATAMKMGEDVSCLLGIDAVRSAYDTTPNTVGYDIDFTSLSVGVEKFTDDNSSFGLLFGVTKGTAEAAAGRGEIDTTGLSLSAFGRTHFGEGGFAQAVVGYQDLSYDTSRFVIGDTATGTTDGSQIFAALSGEYMYQTGAFNVGPTASVEYYKVSVDAFNETGAPAWNLAVGEQSGKIILGSVGVRGDYTVASASGNTLLTGSLAYTTANGDDMLVDTGFVGLVGSNNTVAGLDDNWADLQFGFESIVENKGTSTTILSGGYRGSFGSDYESHGLHLAMKMTF